MTDHPDRAEVAARLALAAGRLNRRIRSSGADITPGQLSALATIARFAPIRPGDLARAEKVAAPTVTRILADLESRGYVSRTADPDDGRSFFVETTELGAAEVQNARSARAQRVLEVFEELDDAEYATIAAAIEAFEKAAGVNSPELTE
ncbi:MarR family winged helix-turn-helix transcriptional regulator [Cnuibacter sp. UC19_7]|uniref:MarR family winged helix-turn-helix transcriptional regulator n=1 Tax=Cnuibacter sp. UC19_7 TaxID=3350166 RepID=UPI003670D464